MLSRKNGIIIERLNEKLLVNILKRNERLSLVVTYSDLISMRDGNLL